MKKVWRFLDENLEETIMIVLLVVITCCIFLNVIMRYFFRNALSWPEELSRYCFVYSGMLSAGYCIKKGSAFRVDLLFAKFPRSMKILMEYISVVLLMLLYAYMGYRSIDLVATTTNISTAMAIPMKYIYLAIPIGMVLGVVRSVQRLIWMTGKVIRKEPIKEIEEVE